MTGVEIISTIVESIERVLQPLAQGLATEQDFSTFLQRFGWDISPTSFAIADVQAAAPVLTDIIAVETLAEQIKTSDDIPPLSAFLTLLDAAQQLVNDTVGLSGGAAPPGIPQAAWDDFTSQVFDSLLIDDLSTRKLGLWIALVLAGVFTLEVIDGGGEPQRVTYTKKTADWSAIGTLLTNPKSLAQTVYGWSGGSGGFAFSKLLDRLAMALPAVALPTSVAAPSQALLDQYYPPTSPFRSQVEEVRVTLMDSGDDVGSISVFLSILPIPAPLAPNDSPQGLSFGFAVTESDPPPYSAFAPFSVTLTGVSEEPVYDGARVELLPSGSKVSFVSTPPTSVNASIELATLDDTRSLVLFGSDVSHRVQYRSMALTLAATGTAADPDIQLSFALSNGAVVIDATEMDSLLQGPVGGSELVAKFDVTLVWSSKSGFHLSGSAAAELFIPLNLGIGALTVTSIHLLASAGSAGAFELLIGASAKFMLGPVVVVVQDVGTSLALTSNNGASPGVFGKLDVDFGFRAPTGVGLSVQAGSVHGGGFIYLDSNAGRYSGALQLSIYDIAVNAFGFIDTKVPGVSYSFVIIISAEFTPIQLGFGFTLNGVGGMVGINRGIDTSALAGLVRAGQSEALLFPKNVVADAPAIVRDLTTVFPATQGRYVFGPLGKLGWGTPTLITGEIGVILEIPGPVVVILGEVKCLLPKPDAPLVKLNVSVDGELDFPKKTFAMDAALHDSVINGYPVSGQMAMRVSWGDQPNFIFSIGGFHPAYTPPPDFPKLQPLAIDLASHGPAKLTVSGFFAVTSNTVQVGGTLSLHASGSGISLDASVSVKALFVFSPFSFEANVDASVKISFHGYGPSVHLSGVLDGPSPWHVKGQVCVSILWWDACLGFDVTFGGNQQVTQPTIDPWVGADADGSTPAIVGLHDALSDAGNWSGALVPGTVSSVTRAQGTDTLVDPVGGLTVRQKTAPVETPNPLTKFGVAKTPQPIKFSGVQATLGTGNNTVPLAVVEPVKEFFAPAQFFDMDDGKKLSSKAFEQYQAGYLFATATGNTQGGSRVTFAPQVQTIVLNGDGTQTPVATPYVPSSDAVAAANQRSAVAKGGLTQAGTRRFVNRAFTQAFTEQIPTFVIADVATLTTVTVVDVPVPAVRSATLIALDAFRAQHLELAAGVQVAAIHELAA